MSLGPATAARAPGDDETGSVRASGHTAPDEEADRPRSARPDRMLAVVSAAAAVVPVVVATVRAIASDWIAVGDNAFFGLRAADVLSEHHPWLGTWTSASFTIGHHVNNPGPLLFEALALPVELGGQDAGLAAGTALLNVASIVGIALVCRRRMGALGVAAGMAAAAALGWSMGSELLFDPWQPHSLLFPLLLFLFMVWGLACGDITLLPWAVAVASLIVQTHVGYALLVPALGAAGVAALVARAWRRRAGEGWPSTRARLVRSASLAAVVAVVCWAQPVLEQLFGDGRGNLSRLASGFGATGDKVGLRDSPRFVAQVVALPPWWGRPSMAEAFGEVGEGHVLASGGAAVAGLVAVAALLVVAGRLAWRRRADADATLAATGLFTVVLALIAAATMPLGLFGVAAHHVRWLWPVSTFVTVAVLVPLLGGGGTALRRAGTIGLTGAAVILGAVTLPYANMDVGPASDADAMTPLRELLPQLAPLREERGVLIDLTGQRFAEPYSTPIMVELQRLGVPWFADDPVLLRQVGPSREHDGSASVRLFVREGDAARQVPPGAERVAFVDGLTDAEAEELAALEAGLRALIEGGDLRQDPQVLTDAELRDADRLLATGLLLELVNTGQAVAPAPWEERLERYAALWHESHFHTIGVFVTPLGDGR